MSLLTKPSRLSCLLLLVFSSCLLLPLVTPAQAQDVAQLPFLAEHYDVAATLDPSNQSLSAVAKVDFRASEVSSVVRVELHPNLHVSAVKKATSKDLNIIL